jgi:hypothetical protein
MSDTISKTLDKFFTFSETQDSDFLKCAIKTYLKYEKKMAYVEMPCTASSRSQ